MGGGSRVLTLYFVRWAKIAGGAGQKWANQRKIPFLWKFLLTQVLDLCIITVACPLGTV